MKAVVSEGDDDKGEEERNSILPPGAYRKSRKEQMELRCSIRCQSYKRTSLVCPDVVWQQGARYEFAYLNDGDLWRHLDWCYFCVLAILYFF